MSDNKVTINLAPYFLAWSLIFGVWAFIAHSWFLVGVALFPWAIFFVLMLGMFALGMAAMIYHYMHYEPIKVTTNVLGRKRVRYVQRGR